MYTIDETSELSPLTSVEYNGVIKMRLEFIVRHQRKRTHAGVSTPKHTQCLLFYNDLLRGYETIVKHAYDEDKPIQAYKFVAEKCIKKYIKTKESRMGVRNELDKALEELKTIKGL